MRVGASSASPSVASNPRANGARRSAPETSTMRRISEKPFECGPLDARPISRSPATMSRPSMIALFSTTPTANPARSYDAGGKRARMLGGLAADQRAAGAFAAGRDALDHLGRDVDVEPLADEVVEEEQRLGALHEDVVDAHRDEVDADRVVPAERAARDRASCRRRRCRPPAPARGTAGRFRSARRSRRCRRAPRGAASASHTA